MPASPMQLDGREDLESVVLAEEASRVLGHYLVVSSE